MSANFTTNDLVKILSGKFRGLTGTVIKTRTDGNNVTRVQVKTEKGIFSYMENSLESTSASNAEASAPVTSKNVF